jgi:hypothetical protein
VVVDPTLGNPDIKRVTNAMAARDWPAVRATLAAASDYQALSGLVSAASDVPGAEVWLPDIVRDELDSTTAPLVYGARAISWAWEARSNAVADLVSRDQFALFFERLRIAEDCLQGVTRREPGNASAWQLLIITARGLQLDLAESRERFDRAVAAEPGHFGAHTQLLQTLCKKWQGSHDLMHEFARRSMLGAPEGSRLGALVPMAYVEETLFMEPAERRKHLKQPAVRQALREAADRSVRHAAYPSTPPAAGSRNAFALVFTLAEEYRLAAEQFRLIGEWVTEDPWQYFDEPGRAFCRFRDLAYAKA